MGINEFDAPPEHGAVEETVKEQNTPLTPEEAPDAQDEILDAAEEESDDEGIKPGVPLTKKQIKKLEKLAKQMDTLEQEQREAGDKYLRLLAEYDNYRKRTQKEKEAIYSDAKAQAVLTLLPIYDNLSRALMQETEDQAFFKGVEMTMNQCKAAFESLGASEIPALGEIFDPERHNAVMHVEDDSVQENTIVEVFQPGFAMGDRIIRFAMVKVAN